MRAEGSCSDCRYFEMVVVHDDDVSDQAQPDTICRRFPPADGWPVVLADDWCGEWSAA